MRSTCNKIYSRAVVVNVWKSERQQDRQTRRPVNQAERKPAPGFRFIESLHRCIGRNPWRLSHPGLTELSTPFGLICGDGSLMDGAPGACKRNAGPHRY